MEPRLGYINRDGQFYPCGYGCHEALGRKLCEQLGLDTRFTYDEEKSWDYYTYSEALTQNGWICIACILDGTPIISYKTLTTAQKDILDNLIEEFCLLDETQYEQAVTNNQENYLSMSYIKLSIQNWTSIKNCWRMDKSDYQYGKLITPPCYGTNFIKKTNN